MQADIQKISNPNTKNYATDEIQIAYDFGKKLYEEFGLLLKAVVLFGSMARRDKHRSSKGDIDILVVADDITINFTPELVEAYRIIVEKIVAKTSTRLHVTSLKLSSFWEYVRAGDPIATNILRDGVALLDTGFIDPLQGLLARGRIRPSPEAVYTYYTRSSRTLHNSKWHLLQATLDLYWSVIDSTHAAIMHLGHMPSSPEGMGNAIEEVLVPRKLATKIDADTMRFFYALSKKILHRELKEVKGSEFDAYFISAQKFVDKMYRVINKKHEQ
ncbi:MAG TPA: nucleotidyltransferase domain-containing protein [Candidatus Nanoarchaeia archaeon]|nr:nucleotidyltransferase domain-containing protein [Candidatus Nanoarchaeia archaeon]